MTTEQAIQAIQNLQQAIDFRFTGIKQEIISLDQSLKVIKDLLNSIEVKS